MSFIYKRIYQIIIRNQIYLILLTWKTTDVYYNLTVVPTYIHFNFAVDVESFLLSVW